MRSERDGIAAGTGGWRPKGWQLSSSREPPAGSRWAEPNLYA